MPQSMQHLSSTFPRTLPTAPLMASLPKNGRPTPSPTPQKSPDPHDIGTSQPVILPKPLPRRPSSLEDHHHIHKHYIQLAMIVMACMVGVIMFLCTVSVLIRYLYSRRYGRNPNTGDAPILFDVNGNPPTWGDDDDFDQEDLAVIHPVWYIRTVGLQQSLIDSITVFKYKKDEGIIDGTECSVCLGEFEHDDTLRLLPKCSHAFHIPCIDTWLRSHKNCPLCRAPVLRDGEARAVDHHAQVENSDNETSEDDDDDDDDDEHDGGGPGASSNSSALELEEEKETQSLRRSASVDSSSANSMLLFRDNYGEKVNSCSKHGSVSSTSSSSTRLASIGRALQLQKRPVSTARSFSHNTNFFFSKHRRSQSSTLPL